MTKKHTYRVLDPNGVEHTRTTARVYTHTVFVRPSHADEVRRAHEAHHEKNERRNFEYYQLIASGNDPYPAKNWKAAHPDKWSAEQIEAEQQRIEAEATKRIADAKAKVEGLDADGYVAKELAKRLAFIEKRVSDGYYHHWQNAGWCGRRDLADKLVALEKGRSWVEEVAVVAVEEPVHA